MNKILEKNDVNYVDEQFLIGNIISKFDYYDDMRSRQLSDNRLISYSIYNSDIPKINDWNCRIQLPEIYELAQTLKSHLVQNLYSHPDGMFDVSGVDYNSQKYANKQKAMLVNVFEEMRIGDEMEKIIDSVVEAGEVTLFVGWERKVKKVRRALSMQEQLEIGTHASFILEDKVVYDNAKVKFIDYEDFVFDKNGVDNWDTCAKIYRTYKTFDEIKSNQSNNMLNPEKLELLKGVVASKKNKKDNKFSTSKIEVLEFWGDIELPTGEVLKNKLISIPFHFPISRFCYILFV